MTSLPDMKPGLSHSTVRAVTFFSLSTTSSPLTMLWNSAWSMEKFFLTSGHSHMNLPYAPDSPNLTSPLLEMLATQLAGYMCRMSLMMVDLPDPPLPRTNGTTCHPSSSLTSYIILPMSA